MRALDLFAGMGGASLGMERAGFKVDAIEFDEKAVELHEAVCWGSVVQADIAGLEPKGMDGQYDLLWASPPCQPFSQAGLRRGMDDPRAHLIFQVPRWVDALRPRFVICEQVKQALPWWERFAEQFEEWGYHTWTGLVSAEQFGVPQTRVRAILMASLDGPVAAPVPTHRKYHTRGSHVRDSDAHLPMFVSMADVIDIDDHSLVGFGRKADTADSINGLRRRDFREGVEPAFTMTSKGRSWSVNTGRDWKPGEDRSTAQQRDAEFPAPTLTSDSSKGWQLVGRQSNATARDHDEPGPTLTSGHDVSQWKVADRLLTVKDGLALQTFPTDCLDGVDVTKTAAFKAIGNSVPPVLAEKLARHLTQDTESSTVTSVTRKQP